MKPYIYGLKQKIVSDRSLNIISAAFFGLIGFFLIKDIFTPLLLAGRGFSGRNPFIKISLFSFYFGIFVLLFFGIQWLVKRIKSLEKHLPINKINSEQNGEPSKTLYIALITLAMGVLIIFVINNLAIRIDTEKWRLTGLDIIPVMEPIGNDFRVGLYWPAENLIKSGFKTISVDGSYASVWPPLVSVLSIPYLLFDTQTAYLVNTALLFILNFLVLLFGTLIVNELLLVNAIKDKFSRIVLSTLLFFIMAFYNFSSYPFLFSIERGNVDIIAMFFIMLSMWTLIKQPKNIWLQVIFLSLATHYKIYPAILFLVLFYRHGRKLFLPMLVVNMAFLFILGPKMALAFIKSVTSEGNGAGIINNWSWVGNHGANSFAKSITVMYPQLSDYFFNLFIVFVLIPVSIWLQGILRVLRNKFTPLNAILLFMISIPLMDLLPTISNDYRLIIETTTFLLFFGLIFFQILHNPGWGHIVELVLVIIIMFFMAKPSYMPFVIPQGVSEASTFFIDNKYLWCLALEGIMVWNIIRQQKQTPVLTN